ncbi:putative tRNA 4-demethylwyosine synthase [Saccharomycopsis crataegensis]|uniref:S-adenosyl-L-methionine-dependent tRNA 4-demethylwyosine synthase n=1 Tax=Saccharomycopsis crataegensis TaxID=43959 RepID=A0AAV5QHE1_9ASCO|nr:putative tRNA 4-demethylwyosine synthase [Saccharomycopsis crataegensis]
MSSLAQDVLVGGSIVTYLRLGGRPTVGLLVATLYALYRIGIQDSDDISEERQDQNDKENVKALKNLKKSTGEEKGQKLRYIKVNNKLQLVRGSGLEEEANALKNTVAVDFTKSFSPASNTSNIDSTKASGKPRRRKGPKIIRKQELPKRSPRLVKNNTNLSESNIFIFYSSLTGSSERTAKYLHNMLSINKSVKNESRLVNIDDDIDDLDEYFLNVPRDIDNILYVMVLPSYETDSPIDFFLQTLEENANDFRIDSYPLKEKILGYSVIGIGDREHYPNKFCYQATETDKYLFKLGARRIFPLGKFCIKNDKDEKIREWCDLYVDSLTDNDAMILDDNEYFEEDDEDYDINGSNSESENSGEGSTLVDIEEMGNMMQKSNNGSETETEVREVKEMVAKDSPTYKSLTKQGYTVVGSHSGVKICRWTKSALRNRGSCYKFAFYGIRSHLCMETTPSLSCSNKCVFCWRHGTNPVGTNWRWQVDGPEEILNGAMEGHYKKIKQMRGVPGINSERFQEAFRIRHCALSLVGEPIFYPYINEFVGMLHEKEISSFLVCNAQHPEQLRNLKKVTQLYVSIDAPTKTDLKKVDRPLFKDFWERLNSCLDILNTVQSHQRTVFRLTLVKGFNMSEVDKYADLITKANPSLIEIKGATFCGSSSGNGNPLTMQNIPFYEECKNFVIALNDELAKRNATYGIAAEHAHSCCILVGHTKYKIDGKWHTHINYDKFFELLRTKGDDFDEMDYVSETPSWAYWGSEEAGFNPADVKYDRKEEKLKKKLAREKAQQEATLKEIEMNAVSI